MMISEAKSTFPFLFDSVVQYNSDTRQAVQIYEWQLIGLEFPINSVAKTNGQYN